MSHETVTVTVQYVGKNDFVEVVPPREDLTAVKVRAMKAFELDPSQAHQYVLQFGGADLPDHKKLSDFGLATLALTLTLKAEVAKG